MDNKQQQSAEEQLRKIAEANGMTMRDFHQLFNKAYIDDEKIRARLIEQQKQEMAYLENTLLHLRYRNESMQNQLLTYELEQKVKEMNEQKEVSGKKWYQLKTRKHENKTAASAPVGIPAS